MEYMSRRARVYLVSGVWLILAIVAVAVRWRAIGALDLPDTDDAMRLAQVRDLFDGQQWGDIDQYRMNPPHGAIMHWSRLVDLPIIAVRAAVEPVAGTAVAERCAVAIAPLLAALFALSMAAVAGNRLGGLTAAAFSVLFLIGTGPIQSLFMPLRIDHHNWQIAMLIGLLAMLTDPRRRFVSGVVAGAFAVAGLMIGIEMLPHIIVISALLVAAWVYSPALGKMLQGYGTALTVGVLIAYPVFVPTARWMLAMCDAMSPVYLVALALSGAASALLPRLEFLSSWQARGLATALVFGSIAVATITLFPQCARGPLAALDPRFLPILAQISEARTLISFLADKPATIAYYALYPVIAAATGAIVLRKSDKERRFALALWLAALLAALALTVLQLRAAAAANAIAGIIAGVVAAAWLPRVRSIEVMPRRILATLGLFIALTNVFPTMAAAAVGWATGTTGAGNDEKNAAAKAQSCTAAATLEPLRSIPPTTIANVVDMGPALLVHTPHTVMAGPYHRNVDAMIDSMQLFRATEDRQAQHILLKYGANYVLACEGMPDLNNAAKQAPNGLWARLSAGKVPAWLEPVPLPDGSPLKLYKVKG